MQSQAVASRSSDSSQKIFVFNRAIQRVGLFAQILKPSRTIDRYDSFLPPPDTLKTWIGDFERILSSCHGGEQSAALGLGHGALARVRSQGCPSVWERHSSAYNLYLAHRGGEVRRSQTEQPKWAWHGSNQHNVKPLQGRV